MESRAQKMTQNYDAFIFVQNFIFVIVFIRFTINNFRFYFVFVLFKSIVIVFVNEMQSFSFSLSLTKIALLNSVSSVEVKCVSHSTKVVDI